MAQDIAIILIIIGKQGRKDAQVTTRLLKHEKSEPKRYKYLAILSLGGKLEMAISKNEYHLNVSQLQRRKEIIPPSCRGIREART